MTELSYMQEEADDDRNIELTIEAGMFEQLLGRHAPELSERVARRIDQRQFLKEIFSGLTSREVSVISLRFSGDGSAPVDVRTIAKELGISVGTVSNSLKSGLGKLRLTYGDSDKLREIFD